MIQYDKCKWKLQEIQDSQNLIKFVCITKNEITQGRDLEFDIEYWCNDTPLDVNNYIIEDINQYYLGNVEFYDLQIQCRQNDNC